MSANTKLNQLPHRDGTSQAGRPKPALDPGYVSVDERGYQDLLAFAREYAKELNYFDENSLSEAAGDWRGFLGDEVDLDDVAAYMEDPSKVSEANARKYSRPHFALFLTFLKLLRRAQEQMNTITRRHLDFYFREALRLTKRAGRPDQVNVLVDLAPTIDQFELPAGALLSAGADSQGADLFYETNERILVNKAQAVKFSSVFADKRVIGIREAREDRDIPEDEAFVKMWEIALGRPLPGDPLPLYEGEHQIDHDFLLSLSTLVSFVADTLFMGFPDFRTLIRLKQRRDASQPEWDEINTLLETAGKNREPGLDWTLENIRDFDANLNLAMGGAPDYDGITEVEDIYDLYDQRIRESVQQFIRDELYFDEIEDFNRMMQIKVRIDNEWAEIFRILREAGARKGNLSATSTFPAREPKELGAFEANLDTAVGPDVFGSLEGIADLDAYYAALLVLERHFYTSAENFAFIMSVETSERAKPEEWDLVYSLVADAHSEKIYADRRLELQKVHEEEGAEEMLQYALGDMYTQSSDVSALDQLREYISRSDDYDFLVDVFSRGVEDPITGAEWERVYRVVEGGQRVRENMTEPVAQQEEWINLYSAEDATSLGVELGVEADEDNPRWKTFGRAETDVTPDSPAPKALGWGISTPVLALSQGYRTVTLTLGFGSDAFNADAVGDLLSDVSPFQIQVSTEKGWVEPDSVTVQLDDYYIFRPADDEEEKDPLPALQFTLTFDENVDPITAPVAEDTGVVTAWPALRLLLRQVWDPNTLGDTGRYITHYKLFKELALQKTHVKVHVKGLAPQQLQNDDTALKVGGPFEPFGLRAAAGSRFFIGHDEFIAKRLDTLTFNLEWMGVPEKLVDHYAAYPEYNSSAIGNFTTRISLVDKMFDLTIASDSALFASDNAANAHSVTFGDVPGSIDGFNNKQGYTYDSAKTVETDSDLLKWNRYIQWELNAPDFQIGNYAMVAAQKSIALSAAISAGTLTPENASQYQVNPPYTPKIKSLSLEYSASVEIDMAQYETDAHVDQIFHFQPFGYCEILPHDDMGTYLFLPQFDHEGELYIGIEALNPPQTLAVLFQMAEGSADPDLTPAPVEWFYLSGDRWLTLDDGNVLSDTTRGLINSGIISFKLAEAAPSALLPAGHYWLRAAIASNSNSVCDTVAIHTQAVAATFADRDNAPDHLSGPLAAESIGDLAVSLPEISAIRQPYTSYGGKMPEDESTFYTRISERLRHKDRALTTWDYEHLVLDRFPDIYKVKCMPTDPDTLGEVKIVVIPDIRDKLPFNPYEPKAPADMIADIKAYLQDKIPPFATVNVMNANYVQVKVRFAVRFREGYNEGYYKQRLNEDLNRYLAPWAYEDGADIVIGGRIYANVIINFIEERPYVDYVAEIKLFSSEDGQNFRYAPPSGEDGYWVETQTPDSVLVAAREHEIDMISDVGYEHESFTGLNYMKVELDFIVG